MGKHYGLDVPTLRKLRIDVDKEWVDESSQPRGIFNIKEVASAMAHGDITFRSGSLPVLVKLAVAYGAGYNVIHAKSLGGGLFEPEWADIQDWITYITGGLNRMIKPPTLAIPPPNLSLLVSSAASPPGKLATSALSLPVPSISPTAVAASSPPGKTGTKALTLPAPSISNQVATGRLLSGAVADDGGATTDETTEANSDTANDMTLLPATPAVNDAYYFGLGVLWDWLTLNTGTPGQGVWTITWEYWNGAWVALAGVVDDSVGFTISGWQKVSFTKPGDWAATAVGGIANLYWIRARVSSYTSVTVQPLGTRARCFVIE